MKASSIKCMLLFLLICLPGNSFIIINQPISHRLIMLQDLSLYIIYVMLNVQVQTKKKK